jgi:hypothetical protein
MIKVVEFWVELCRANFSPGSQHVLAAKVVVKLWGGVRHFGEIIKDLELYSRRSLLLWFCLE